MAKATRRNRPAVQEVDVRAALLDHYRGWQKRAERIRDPKGRGEPVPAADPFGEAIRAIEAGEPIEVTAWQLPKEARVGFNSWDRVRVDADGSIVKASETRAR